MVNKKYKTKSVHLVLDTAIKRLEKAGWKTHYTSRSQFRPHALLGKDSEFEIKIKLDGNRNTKYEIAYESISGGKPIVYADSFDGSGKVWKLGTGWKQQQHFGDSVFKEGNTDQFLICMKIKKIEKEIREILKLDKRNSK